MLNPSVSMPTIPLPAQLGPRFTDGPVVDGLRICHRSLGQRIWAPNINGTTFPAEFNQFYFSKSLQLRVQAYGSISIAVDDFAEVSVNGRVVGTTGSIVSFSA